MQNRLNAKASGRFIDAAASCADFAFNCLQRRRQCFPGGRGEQIVGAPAQLSPFVMLDTGNTRKPNRPAYAYWSPRPTLSRACCIANS
jgi:hypothetical protein